MHNPSIYKFPYDTNLHYLPLVYLLPPDLLAGYSILRNLPRSIGKLNASMEWGKAIRSGTFLMKS